MEVLLLAGIAYLIGAIPFGYLVARARGVDVLRQGSGNIGATNVARVVGPRWGVLVFLLDAAKGALPVLLAGQLAQPPELPPDTLRVTAGIAAFLGHLFPLYLGFRGGKGVATGAGVVLVLLPGPAVAALLVWATVLACTRYVSLASLLAALALCGLRLLFAAEPWSWGQCVVTLFCLLGASLIVVRHASNVRRLLLGTEHRVKDAPGLFLLAKTIHVLALGLWFGTAAFFTLTGALVFRHFEEISRKPAEERPSWFPLPKLYDQPPPSARFRDPLRLEQGSRAGGAAVGPLFPWYYGVQAACGLLALATALTWAGRGEKTHRLRAALLLAALLTVGLGWWLERVVHDLREPRNASTERALAATSEKAERVAEAEVARATFGRWHTYSLLLNFLALALVMVAMALAAQLPGPVARPAEAPEAPRDWETASAAKSAL